MPPSDVQSSFYMKRLHEGRPLTVLLVSGPPLRQATLERFDQHTLLFQTPLGPLLLYKAQVAVVDFESASAAS